MPASAEKGALHVPSHPVRFVTSTALFDGHDAAINIMRRIMQAQGAEVVHLGHDRSVREVVDAVIDEAQRGETLCDIDDGNHQESEHDACLRDYASGG